jgi:hypothetical protein
MSTIRRLIRYSLPLAFLGMSGCVSVIESLADRQPQGLSNAPRMLSVPRAQTQAYESPIPKWNSAYRGVGENPMVERRVARALDFADIVRDGVVNLTIMGGRRDAIRLTPLGVLFCVGGVPQNHEKNWWGNTYSLQPGGLALAIGEQQVKSRCEMKYLRTH